MLFLAIPEMRKHIAWYLHGIRGASKMRVQINHIESADEALEVVRQFLEEGTEEG